MYVNLNGHFATSDGHVGQVASTPELAELDAFLSVLNSSILPVTLLEKSICALVKAFKRKPGSVLEIRTSKQKHELVHTFQVCPHRKHALSYDEAEALCTKNGWTISCWSPLELDHEDGSFATGQAAKLVLASLS